MALTETQAALSKIQSELQESLARLADLQLSSEEQNQKLEEELKQALADRDAAASELQPLVSVYLFFRPLLNFMADWLVSGAYALHFSFCRAHS